MFCSARVGRLIIAWPVALPVHGDEEPGDVAGHKLWLLGERKVTAAWHQGPAADFLQPFGPFPR